MNIEYTIQIHTYWHCGSGLAAGADVDALVIKDRQELPYIPGKTIKGLVREAVDDLLTYKRIEGTPKGYAETFGFFDDKDNKKKAETFFQNATFEKAEADQIVNLHLQKNLYTDVASTAIGSDGVAENHSLRKVQVALPCQLRGFIYDIPNQGMADLIKEAMKLIKNIGMDRNRGLGRCTWKGEIV